MKTISFTEEELQLLIMSLISYQADIEYSDYKTEYDEEIIKNIEKLLKNKIRK